MESEPERASAASAVSGGGRAALFVGLLAVLVLCAWSPVFRPSELHVYGLNDQVGYITTARWFADHAELRSHLVTPAFLDTPNWRVYMPGYYAVLAGAYRLLGSADIVWILPSLASYVLSAVLVFLIGRRIYSAAVGVLAAVFFLAYPLDIAFAFTAMSEPASALVALASFYAFLRLPERTRVLWIPLLLVPPFLFRETGAFLAVPMGLYALSRSGRASVRPLALAALGSVVLLGGLYKWQTTTGKQAAFVSWLVTGETNFTDLMRERELPEPTTGELLEALVANTHRNLELFGERVTERAGELTEPVFVLVGLLFALLALVAFGVHRGRDGFALGAGLLSLVTFGLLIVTHVAFKHVTIRFILFAFPFTVIAAASLFEPLVRTLATRGRGLRLACYGGLLVPLVAASVFGTLRRADEVVLATPAFYTDGMEFFGHDDTKLLVSPAEYGITYTLRHYPVRWCFVPENDGTLRVLAERFAIGTLIVPASDLGTKLTPSALRAVGLVRVGEFQTGAVVFKDPEGVAELRRRRAAKTGEGR